MYIPKCWVISLTDTHRGLFKVCDNMMINTGIPWGQHLGRTWLKDSKNTAAFKLSFKYQEHEFVTGFPRREEWWLERKQKDRRHREKETKRRARQTEMMRRVIHRNRKLPNVRVLLPCRTPLRVLNHFLFRRSAFPPPTTETSAIDYEV